ncbi:MAG TPA: DedA family protein [Gaiellaceae bacterium]|jgi:membrane protein DedA with SNARE-associated domain|nr:DedA family protein [Gaiellaceae bacterium]
MLASISSSFTSQVASHGVYAVFGLMAIDAVFPAASEIVMLYAGAVAAGVLANAHHVSAFGIRLGYGMPAFIALALAGTLGYFAGALIGWAIGRFGGRPLLERRGRWLHLAPEKLDRAERWFAKWGNLGVLVGRVTPVVRSFVSIPAGVFEMPLAPYSLFTLVGSAVWAFAIAGAGYGLGRSYERFNHGFKYAEYAVVAGVLLLAAYLIYRWVRAARVSRRADSAR